MKQLIRRDLWLCRKAIAPYLVIISIFLLLASMVILSARFGNIAKYSGGSAESVLDSLEYIGLFAGILLLCSIETVSSLNISDHLGGWYNYLKASGMKSSRIVGQKYLDVALLLCISWLSGLVTNAFLGLLAGRAAADMGLMSVVMGVMLIYLEYNIMLGFVTKGKRNDLLMILPLILITGIVFIVFGFAFGHKDFLDILIEKIKNFIADRPLLYGITLAAVVFFSILNYLLSLHFFNKEKRIKLKETDRPAMAGNQNTMGKEAEKCEV